MFFLAKTCDPVVVPSGAMVRQSRCTQQNANNFNDVCIFYCLPGYQITDPAHTKLTCGADALWKGTPPTCKRKYYGSIVLWRRYRLTFDGIGMLHGRNLEVGYNRKLKKEKKARPATSSVSQAEEFDVMLDVSTNSFGITRDILMW